jgi:hypothetical protein
MKFSGIFSLFSRMFRKSDASQIVEVMEFCFDNQENGTCTPEKIRRKFGSNAYDKFKLFCTDSKEPYFCKSPMKNDEPLKLTGAGIRKYLEMTNELRSIEIKKSTHTWNVIYIVVYMTLVALTIVVSATNWILISQQTAIQAKQLELINISAIPNGASVYFWTDQGRYDFSKAELNGSANGVFFASVPICLANTGRISSGPITGASADGNISIKFEAPNIPAGGFVCSDSKVTPLNCNTLENCTEKNCPKYCDFPGMPSGLYDVPVKFTCTGPCINNGWNETIRLCIWENSASECGGQQ